MGFACLKSLIRTRLQLRPGNFDKGPPRELAEDGSRVVVVAEKFLPKFAAQEVLHEIQQFNTTSQDSSNSTCSLNVYFMISVPEPRLFQCFLANVSYHVRVANEPPFVLDKRDRPYFIHIDIVIVHGVVSRVRLHFIRALMSPAFFERSNRCRLVFLAPASKARLPPYAFDKTARNLAFQGLAFSDRFRKPGAL